MIIPFEPPSNQQTQVDGGSESPSHISGDVSQGGVTVDKEGGSPLLYDPAIPNYPKMLSESEVCDEFRVVTDSVLPGVKSHGLPGQKEVDRLSAPPDPKSGRLLKLWDDKVTKWFLEIHDHSKGHTGLKRTMSKLFELPDFQRMSLRGLIPLDLEGRIAEKIKSCITCQTDDTRISFLVLSIQKDEPNSC